MKIALFPLWSNELLYGGLISIRPAHFCVDVLRPSHKRSAWLIPSRKLRKLSLVVSGLDLPEDDCNEGNTSLSELRLVHGAIGLAMFL